jgi:cytochrome c oxidase accessory protein FixG
MPIDLTDRIIQPIPKKAVALHPVRRAAQIALGILLVLAPIENWLRVDITAGRFWIVDQSFTAQNMVILFYVCALGATLLLAVSVIYGRWWCGWVCPQTLASDFGDSLRDRFNILLKTRAYPRREPISTSLWAITMVAMAIATAAVVLTYFYPSQRVWSDVFRPFSDSRITIHLAIVAGVIGADLLFVRRHFCRRGCPYGLMLSLIGDQNTMTVRYLSERADDCIECGKCVTICPMSIDIRDGANQMECIGCGECIDACNDILPKIKSGPKPGLIELRYGLQPERAMSGLSTTKKLGLWDARRIFIACAVAILASGMFFEIFGSHATSVSVLPSGTIRRLDGTLFEPYDLTIANGKPRNINYKVSVAGMNGLFLYNPSHNISVARSAQRTVPLMLAAPAVSLARGERYPINITIQSLNNVGDRHSVDTIFYVPGQ